MTDLKVDNYNKIYKDYSKAYREGDLNCSDKLNMLNILLKQDRGIVKDSVHDFEDWVIEVDEIEKAEASEIISTLKQGVDNRFHIINPLNFSEKLIGMLRTLYKEYDSRFNEKEFLLSEPIRLVQLICDKGGRIKKMEQQKKALHMIINDIQNKKINRLPEIELLIKTFTDDFFQRTNVKRERKEIETYLKVWVNKVGGYGRRANAKREAINICPTLESISDGALENWEKKWKEFLSSRTEN